MTIRASIAGPIIPPLVAPLGGAALPWESGGGGVALSAPVNTVAPVISSDGSVIGVGETLTTTNGTWTGTPAPTFTYQWQRGATFGGGGSWADIAGQTASTHVVVAADVGYSLKCVVTATNAVAAVAASSNTLLYLHATDLPNTAIGVSQSGITLADSDTTVDMWAGEYGGKAANVSLDAVAATNRPANSATGGPNGQRMVVFDGVDNYLRDAAVTAWGFGPAAGQLDVVGLLAGAESAGDVLLRYVGTLTVSHGVTTTPALRLAIGATSTGTTTVTGTHRQMTGSWVSGASGTQSCLINNVAEDTDAQTQAAQTDAGSLALSASVAGGSLAALSCLAWAATFIGTEAAALSVAQRANLSAFLQNATGRP